VILFRRIGSLRLRLHLGCRKFSEYSIEDNWVWPVIASLVLLLLSPQGWPGRVGANILYAMSVLYIFRGMAVMFNLITRQEGGLLLKLLVVATCFPPLCLVHLGFGLLDTWVDFRKRAVINNE
ncbi:MAG: DUF2232 domain-containing protein, partial [Gemmatimonadota bacterium]|nr:DUF2232 domain-containing protein [Gemmatimonadota bacterium]